ncbi:Gfo/Idh/MocA family protein [Brasilonema bromeliae]|uniref:Gfo/Idh/MocA family oxidoreductase n=1 Tax=Brasilonema bromeliae SPC951 TaxID=385972 RepID=A0ABX1PEF7_9CYAN|nr:Gfo/Idh/MocA family oxidoreductase [Brasilonema bromeliae]NMG22343.1 gfo/Idh/MocA family oxidoreductase [Brasilonema bromeliae SPC951]
MLRIGVVGIGFMGMIHYLAWRRVSRARVTAISTRNAQRLAGDWRDVKGNFGPPGEVMDLSGVQKYARYEDLLADPEVDVVDLCSPPDKHCEMTLAAFAAGKHVLVEKPIALHPHEAERMTAAAKESGKRLLVAHVLPFLPEFAYAVDAIRGAAFGKFLGGFFRRIVSEPTWIPDFFNPNTVGGPIVDLHIHDAHLIRVLAGMPASVVSSGRTRGDVVEFFTTQFRFADPKLHVVAQSGVIAQQGRPFTHGFEIHLEGATLVFDSQALVGQTEGTGVPLTVLDKSGGSFRPPLGSSDPVDGFVAELTEAADAIETGRPSPLLAGELARDALVLCHRQTEAVRSGEIVAVAAVR